MPRMSPPTETPRQPWRPPLLWRLLLRMAPTIVGALCRLRVTGTLPQIDGGFILAGNHIGVFDPIAFTAACRIAKIAPRIMATGGLFDAPIAGWFLRRSGHIRVNRWQHTVGQALVEAIAAVNENAIVMGYPEGRITRDPNIWPEHHGKTGLARLALATGAPIVPVTQWGAHEVIVYHGLPQQIASAMSALFRRPIVRVHFGSPIDSSTMSLKGAGAANRLTAIIMSSLTDELRALRAAEPTAPRYSDPTRPTESSAKS